MTEKCKKNVEQMQLKLLADGRNQQNTVCVYKLCCMEGQKVHKIINRLFHVIHQFLVRNRLCWRIK